jgi:hypothetical protein
MAAGCGEVVVSGTRAFVRCCLPSVVLQQLPPGTACPRPTPARAMPNPLNPPISQLVPWLTPIPQLAPPTKSHVAPRPTLFPLTLRRVPPLPGNDAHWQESSPPTMQCNQTTLSNFVPWPTPTPPTPQRMMPPTLLTSQPMMPQTPQTSFSKPNPLPSLSQLPLLL